MARHPLARLLRARNRVSPEEAGRILAGSRSVLLVKPHHKLGDLMVATPLVRNLRRAFPRQRLVFLAGRYNAGAVLDNPDLDRVLVAETRGPRAALAAPALVARLRREGCEVALVLSTISQSSTAVALARWSGATLVAGLDDEPYGGSLARRAYDCVIPAPGEERIHMVDYHLRLLEGLGVPVTWREHVLGVTDEQKAAGAEALARVGLDPRRPILGLQPGGTPGRRVRHWSPAHYAAVAQRARCLEGWQVALLGQPQDAEVLAAIQGLSRSPFPCLDRLSFAEYKGVLSRLAFFFTHDGGPAHLAAGLGIPTFVIYLVTPAWRWAPYGNHVHAWDEAGGSPSPTEVWERLRPLLERHQATPTG